MVKDPKFHYEPVERHLRPCMASYHKFYHDIRVDGKMYMMCPYFIKELRTR